MNETGKDLRGKKILIVDDTPANIDVLSQILEQEGYNISVATSGKSALDLVPLSSPDLILLDVMMPGIDGFETCRQLKAREEFRDIPVIFITAKSETEDIIQGFALGGVDYITKPFRHEEVCVRVRNHLQLRELIQRLESKNRQLLELNELRNRFLGMAAHDLRGPLASIKGFSKFLLEDGAALPERTRAEFSGNIHLASQNMLNLVSDLLDISIIESGRLELRLQTASLKSLVEERVRLHRYSADKKNISIHPDLVELPDFPFDPNRMGQVLDNLISNAIKFSPTGKNIFLGLKQTGDNAEFSVRDEGPGIPPDDQDKLFQQFRKLSARPTGGETSHGLGLSIAKVMVEAHNGTLTFTSDPKKGTTFRFSIPMKVEKSSL